MATNELRLIHDVLFAKTFKPAIVRRFPAAHTVTNLEPSSISVTIRFPIKSKPGAAAFFFFFFFFVFFFFNVVNS